MQDAGGLIGWAASKPLIFTMGEVLAVPLLVLLTVFGLLVVTATPVNAIPQRLRLLGIQARASSTRRTSRRTDGEVDDDERYEEQWREAVPGRARRSSARRSEAPADYDPDHAEEEALVQAPAAAQGLRCSPPWTGRWTPWTWPRRPPPRWTVPCCTACRPPRSSPTSPGTSPPSGERAATPGARPRASPRSRSRSSAGPKASVPDLTKPAPERVPAAAAARRAAPAVRRHHLRPALPGPAGARRPRQDPQRRQRRGGRLADATSSRSSRSTRPSPASPAARRSPGTRSSWARP